MCLLFSGYPLMTPVGEQQPGEPSGSGVVSPQRNSLPCVVQNYEMEECIQYLCGCTGYQHRSSSMVCPGILLLFPIELC